MPDLRLEPGLPACSVIGEAADDYTSSASSYHNILVYEKP